MSFYEDYVADGSCCMCCGVFIGEDSGFPRACSDCDKPIKRAPATQPKAKMTRTQRRNAQKRRAKARKKADEKVTP